VTGIELALYTSTLALPLVSASRLGFRLTAANAFQAVWAVVIAIPVALRYAGMDTAAKERLFVSTAIVNVVLIGIVVVTSSSRFESWTRSEADGDRAGASGLPRWFWWGMGVSLGLVALHATLMPRVPLLELLLRNDLTANQLTEAREAANKLLPLPLPVKYVLYWNVRVLVPILLVMLALVGSAGARLLWFPVLIIATSLTLEKSLPFFAVVAAGLGVGAYRRGSVLARPVVLGVLLGVGIAVTLQTAVKIREIQAEAVRGQGGGRERSDSWRPTPRTADAGFRLSWGELATYPLVFVSHRILTGPADVAYRWFEYFPEVSGGFLYGRAWVVLDRSRPDFEHPAHMVGRYAYHRVDPEHYLETAHAYGAFHADAWANFGYLGVAAASVLVGLVILVTDVTMAAAASPLGAGAAGAALTILLVTLPGGGLQAALVPQGLILALPLAVGESLQWQGLRKNARDLRG